MFSQNRNQPISIEFRGCFPHAEGTSKIIYINNYFVTFKINESTPKEVKMPKPFWIFVTGFVMFKELVPVDLYNAAYSILALYK